MQEIVFFDTINELGECGLMPIVAGGQREFRNDHGYGLIMHKYAHAGADACAWGEIILKRILIGGRNVFGFFESFNKERRCFFIYLGIPPALFLAVKLVNGSLIINFLLYPLGFKKIYLTGMREPPGLEILVTLRK